MTMRRSNFLRMALILAATVISGGLALAQGKAPTIDGYDPVAYFTEKKPVQGKTAFSFDFDGKLYLFSSNKNRDMFAANPDRYEPQFNGLCSGNVAKGHKVKSDPKVWRIVDGKLYLFAGPQNDEAAVTTKVQLAQSKWKEIK